MERGSDMEDILPQLWALLGLPQVWGLILTTVVIGTGVLLRVFIGHLFTVQVEKLKSAERELEFIRQHYAGIKEYSSAQAQGLRQAYLVLFEPKSSHVPVANATFDERVDFAIQALLEPVRNHLGVLDNLNPNKIYAVANYVRSFKGSETKPGRITFYEITERSKSFVKADRIAYRLGLIERPLYRSKEVEMVRVRVLGEGIPIVGEYTNPSVGLTTEISDDEWESEDIQKLVKENKIEKFTGK